MKLTNRVLIFFLTATISFTSCKKDEVEGTATQETAGEW